MTKKLLYIALGGMFIFGVLFLLWSWLFSGGKSATQTNGTFGTAADSSQNAVPSNLASNGQTNLGQNTSNGTVTLGTNGQNISGGGSGANTNGSNTNGGSTNKGGTGGGTTGSGGTTSGGSTSGGSIGTNGKAVFTTVSPNISGVQWLTSTSTRGGGISTTGSGNGFNQTSINGINGASIGGTVPTIGGTVGNSGSGGLGLDGALLGAGVAGFVSCGLRTANVTTALGVGTNVTTALTTVGLRAVPVADQSSAVAAGTAATQASLQSGDQTISFAGCIVNTLAKAALKQITASVVNWINSGFNGQPSFVSNYNQFFTDVADLAAGDFIQGSGLAFLCSPFKLQIKIAVAQSYANRSAQSCTLSKVINNVNGFMNGNFSQGGWPGLLSVTTMPTNNPYGAYAYAQIGLANAQTTALANAKNNISPTGFLSMSEQKCGLNTTFTNNSDIVRSGQNSQAAQVSCPSNCTCRVSTPGSIIEGTLQNSLKSQVDQLGLASSLDQIISALTTQLVTKTLQNGLSNLSGTTGLQNSYQTPDQLAAQNQAQALLSTMQSQVVYAQQYGSILQGSIRDIQNAQSSVNSLINCWTIASSSLTLTEEQQQKAQSNAVKAQATFDSLTVQVNSFNNAITSVNAEIATIEQLQTEALSVASTADVQALANNYNVAQSAHPFIAPTDIITAQQNRSTLQSQLASTNSATQASLQQCQAFH